VSERKILNHTIKIKNKQEPPIRNTKHKTQPLTIIVNANITGHGLADQTQGQSSVGGRRLRRHDLADGGPQELRVALDAEIHVVD
jgi:hypothetical protein